MDIDDAEACYRAVTSRDSRFDGVFYTAVRSTGIYCRPSCPARTPRRRNVTFHRTAAAAQAAGYRACKRCLPDATPGSPHWDIAGDVAGRAMRLVADGVVEREGVEGLSRRLGYTSRHLHRILTTELGAGPLALARAQRAQQARLLVETTDWRLSDVAFAAGFASVRQFNDTIREVYATTPGKLRRQVGRGAAPAGAVRLDVRIPVRAPFHAAALLRFLAAHVVDGVEAAGPGWYARSLRLPHGPGTVRVDLGAVGRQEAGTLQVPCALQLSDLRDMTAALERCRRLLDADCDPVAVDGVLGADALLADAVAQLPGLRVPGHPNGDELALRTVLGQQVSVAAGNRLAGVLCGLVGEDLPDRLRTDGLTRLFPDAATVADVDPTLLPMPRARAATVVSLAVALAEGTVVLDRSLERGEVEASLTALHGIGPWTARYVRMRALGDPDVFLEGDVAARRVLRGLEEQTGGGRSSPEQWRPWRSYALMHLWTLALGTPRATRGPGRRDGEEL